MINEVTEKYETEVIENIAGLQSTCHVMKIDLLLSLRAPFSTFGVFDHTIF